MSNKELQTKAAEIRQSVIEMLIEAGGGHSAGPLGMADVMTALYFEVLTIDPEKPDDKNRDRLILSCGHICPVLYATLAARGYFPKKILNTFAQFGSPLQGHPHNLALPGVEVSAGPLGQGVSQGVGVALAARLKKEKWQTYTVLSDGEHNEGQTWEAVMLAGKEKLHNLVHIIDRNNIQIGGFTETLMPLEPLEDKYRSFNWHVLEADGHNFDEILAALRHARAVFEKPTAIIFHTVPGKGVDFMERDWHWHSGPLNKEAGERALRELRTLRGKIQGAHE